MKRAPRPRWTEVERDVLRAHYERVSAAGCAEMLPGREAKGIRQQAWKLGLKDPNPPASLRAPLQGENLDRAMAMRDAGMSYRAIGNEFGLCAASTTNAILGAQCRRAGFIPARRDSSGAVILPEIRRMRGLMMQGLKNRDIQLQMAVSGACVTNQRRRYEAELRAKRLGHTLPPPGGGATYSGRKIPRAAKLKAEDIFMQGYGRKRVSEATGISLTQCSRLRNVLIRRLARKGQALPGCDLSGRRIIQKDSTKFVPQASVDRLKELLLDGVPVKRAAAMLAIGSCTGYRIRDELAAELAAQGRVLSKPILPGRVDAELRRELDRANWLPKGTIYRFRALVKLHGDEAAAKIALFEQLGIERQDERDRRIAEASRRPSFEEQLARVRAGAAVVAVPILRKAMPDITYGGIGSAAL